MKRYGFHTPKNAPSDAMVDFCKSVDARTVEDNTQRVKHIVGFPLAHALRDRVHADVLELEAESAVGASCIRLLKAANAAIMLCDEPEIKQQIAKAVCDQCEVWLFG